MRKTSVSHVRRAITFSHVLTTIAGRFARGERISTTSLALRWTRDGANCQLQCQSVRYTLARRESRGAFGGAKARDEDLPPVEFTSVRAENAGECEKLSSSSLTSEVPAEIS